ncbi:MAG: phosphoglycerate kinase [Alphaproteobacteria bacterium]
MILTLEHIPESLKRIVVRADLNVPMNNGVVRDDTRIVAVLPTLKELLNHGKTVYLISHLGRPKGTWDPRFSLAPVAETLKRLLPAYPVIFDPRDVTQVPASVLKTHPEGSLILLENVRFYPGEETNCMDFGQKLAEVGDAYVNDAFASCHRAHTSTCALARLLPSFAGRLLQRELEALETTVERTARPTCAVVGGSKVSTKIDLLKNLMNKVDHLCIGGAMANTFLFALGKPVGRSLYEPDLAPVAQEIISMAANRGRTIHLPVDAVVAGSLEAGVEVNTVACADVAPEDLILDIGPLTRQAWANVFDFCKTVIWNGPVGAFEVTPFAGGSVFVAQTLAQRTREGRLCTIAGGGDTLSVLNVAGVMGDFTFVSTAGGAFLEWLEGKPLPGLQALKQRHLDLTHA